MPREVGNGITLSTITGLLQVKDKVHNIRPCTDPTSEAASSSGSNYRNPPTREQVLTNVKYEYGTIDVDMLMKRLMQDGITNIKMERTGSGLALHLTNEETIIKFDEK